MSTATTFDRATYRQRRRRAKRILKIRNRCRAQSASVVPELDELQYHSAWQRTDSEELINTATHGLGLMLAVVGALIVTTSAWQNGNVWHIVGCAIYGLSLIAVYAASTLSHSCSNVRWKNVFRRLDQGFIYLLIVGTYTPFGLAYWRTTAGWLMLAALWSVAILGFFSKVVMAHRVHTISMWSYIVLGWLPILSVPAISPSLPLVIGGWMLVGGLCYTIGTLFLLFDARIRHFHAVWHVLVIAGSAFHFLGILESVARAAN
jgi:hemolysin III